jgi:hypothetical protein
MMKDVPIVGWDVTFTDKGVFLLEVCMMICLMNLYLLKRAYLYSYVYI